MKIRKLTVLFLTLVMLLSFVPANAVAEEPEKSEFVDYATALQYSLYLYDANMCGTEVDERCALDWRGDCHTYDIFEYNGKEIDLTGGFHDAGDHVKFGLPAAYTALTLHLAYYEFGDAFKKTKQDVHLKAILDHFTEYFKKCAVYGDDGKIETFCYQVGTGGGDYDHGYWGPPEDQPKEYIDGERKAYFTSPDNTCSDIVAGTAAALAAHYVNFGDKEALKVAKDLFQYVRDNELMVSEVPQYPRWESASDPNDPWCYISLASLWLNKATNTEDYGDMNNPLNIGKRFTDWPCNWDGVWPMVNILSENWYTVRESNCKNNKGDRYRFVMEWGSARLNANMQFIGLVYDKHNDDTNDRFTNWARGQMDILFGNNANNQAFMVGYNTASGRDDIKYPQFPHHRASDGNLDPPGVWDIETKEPMITRPQAHVLVGALVGGPETFHLDYYDSLTNYVGNEVALDYNAGLVGALAGLYLVYGGGEVVDPPSLIAPDVNDKYALSNYKPINNAKSSSIWIIVSAIAGGVILVAAGGIILLKKKKAPLK